MTMHTKQEILQEQVGGYCAASKQERGHIIKRLCAVTGMHPKSVIRRLNQLRAQDGRVQKKKSGARARYGPAVSTALKEVWILMHQIGSERLHPQLPEYVRVLRNHGDWRHDQETTELLLQMSLATCKRRVRNFAGTPKRGRGMGATKPSLLKEVIPIRRGPWEDPHPGFGEIDTVAHCGTSLLGSFAYTVQYTDVATLWTLLSGQWNKGEEATRASIEAMRSRLPFPLRGIDPDSGSEFINWHLKDWCDMQKIQMTRSRPYRKNDHARIEQKNYTNVREFVGYGRFDDQKDALLLNKLHLVLEQYINFFLPSMKCIEKKRVGSKYIRTYDVAQTAYTRVLSHPLIDDSVKEKLKATYATLNPKVLKSEIDRLSIQLFKQTRQRKQKPFG